jgi:hypothetical protein
MVAAAAGLLVRTWRNLNQQQTAGHDPPYSPLSLFFFLQSKTGSKKHIIKKK